MCSNESSLSDSLTESRGSSTDDKYYARKVIEKHKKRKRKHKKGKISLCQSCSRSITKPSTGYPQHEYNLRSSLSRFV